MPRSKQASASRGIARSVRDEHLAHARLFQDLLDVVHGAQRGGVAVPVRRDVPDDLLIVRTRIAMARQPGQHELDVVRPRDDERAPQTDTMRVRLVNDRVDDPPLENQQRDCGKAEHREEPAGELQLIRKRAGNCGEQRADGDAGDESLRVTASFARLIRPTEVQAREHECD
jgi:hypothetical protein